MKYEVTVPEVGESITSGILTTWLKDNGALIQEGEDLFELETDKATLAVPSPFSGLLQIMVEPDTEVEVGQAVAAIDAAAEGKTATGEKAVVDNGEPAAANKTAAGDSAAASPNGKQKLSPAVQRIVAEHSVDVTSIRGTGKDGRLTKADVLEAVAAAPIQPATGRKQNRVKMTPIRKRIAERLVQARQNAAHLTTFNEIDMLRVTEIRKRYRESFQKRHEIKLGFMSFFVKACTQAIAAFPEVNAILDGDEVVYHNYVDMGIAVSTDRGLIVPVIRDADKKSFADIEREIAGFAVRAKDKKLTVNELTGGTFSITNGGVFGSLMSTPIPNPPQTAILGMHAIQQRPVVFEGEIVARPMMYVALTYDHRVLDGREAVSFLFRVKELVEDPDALLIGL